MLEQGPPCPCFSSSSVMTSRASFADLPLSSPSLQQQPFLIINETSDLSNWNGSIDLIVQILYGTTFKNWSKTFVPIEAILFGESNRPILPQQIHAEKSFLFQSAVQLRRNRLVSDNDPVFVCSAFGTPHPIGFTENDRIRLLDLVDLDVGALAIRNYGNEINWLHHFPLKFLFSFKHTSTEAFMEENISYFQAIRRSVLPSGIVNNVLLFRIQNRVY